MKKDFSSFYGKYKLQLTLSIIAIILVVCILCFALIPVKTELILFDYNDGGNYCHDLVSAGKDNINLSEYDNVYKVGEFIDNTADNYILHYDNRPYQKDYDGTYSIYLTPHDFAINSIAKTGGSDKLKIELFVSTNINNAKLIDDLFNFGVIYDDFKIIKHNQNSIQSKNRKVYALYRDGLNGQRISDVPLGENPNTSYLTWSYLTVITTGDGVTCEILSTERHSQ